MTIEATLSPDQLLDVLGITEPKDIDIEAIAYYCGARIEYEPLSGCEANIVGYGNRAVITVNNTSLRTRQRFSAGHELGHWMKDRGQSAYGCSKKQMDSEWSANNPETRANTFAAELLLPKRMFIPLAKGHPITVETVRDLGAKFQMSLTATALRLVTFGSFPSILLYFEGDTRKWFKANKGVPKTLYPAEILDAGTVSAQLLEDEDGRDEIADVRADRWFYHPKADRYYIKESCFRTSRTSVVTLLWWEDESQIIDLEEEEERRASRSSYSGWRDD